jgi:NtrC-family two-component system response regulator AlgB
VEALPSSIVAPASEGVEIGAHVTVEQVVAEHIRRLVASSSTIQEAADILGIDPSTVWRKRKRHGM